MFTAPGGAFHMEMIFASPPYRTYIIEKGLFTPLSPNRVQQIVFGYFKWVKWGGGGHESQKRIITDFSGRVGIYYVHAKLD
jgi:hypothetical protein